MNNNIRQFLESLEKPNTIKVVNSVLKNVEDDIEHYNLAELEQFILSLKPNSPKAIITTCYVLGLYAKWLKEENIIYDDTFYQMIQSFDRKVLWEKAKPNTLNKFISHEEYKDIIHNIGMYEDYNALYYQTLFKCIYEGIYNDDMSVIKNLRISDIQSDTIILLKGDNGDSYKLEVSKNLVAELKELASIDVWERRNRYGICKVAMKGAYPDSCFKVEDRKTDSDGAYRFSYYARLRKISKEYLERNILPLQLYISGIMYRIRCELEKHGISLEDAFANENRNRLVASVISNELHRCNYDIDVRNFREIVKGHLDIFAN